MSQFPIDDTTGSLVEAVNYLLSGPTSIGQNFEGLSAVGINRSYNQGLGTETTQTYLTGLPIPGPSDLAPIPYAQQGQPGSIDNAGSGTVLFYYPIWNTLSSGLSITAITPVTATGRKITVTVNLVSGITGTSQLPFVLGQQVVLSGITPSSFNGTYTVLSFSTTTPGRAVLIQDVEETWGAYVSGGVLKINDPYGSVANYYERFFTGLQAIVTVTGPTDRVFISSQMNQLKLFTYTNVDTTSVDYTGVYVNLEINRYRAVQKTTLPDTGASALYAFNGTAYAGYIWELDTTIVSVPTQVIANLAPTTVDVNNLGDVIYNNVIDNPGIGTYLYAFQISQDSARDPGYPDVRLILGGSTTGVRSFTAQAIKR